MTMKFFAAVLASGVSATALYAPSACAQTGELTYNIEAQRLSDALRKYSDISGREVIAASSLLEGRRSNRVRGRLSPDAALSRLLSGTGLTIELVEGAWVLRAGNGDAAEAGSTDGVNEAIVVTGTRIRGAGPVGSPVVTLGRADIEKSGTGSVQQLLQALPQAFAGGPNETTLGATTRNGAGTDGTYGSSVNLRGLGPSSTLVPDTRHIPFPDESFDIVLAISVLEYVRREELADILLELRRLLRPGGLLLVSGTASRLAPREVHSGRWFVNYWPRWVDRKLPGRTSEFQRGLNPLRLVRAFTDYENLDRADRGARWCAARKAMGQSPAKLRAARWLARLAAPLGLSVGMVGSSFSAAWRKPGAIRP